MSGVKELGEREFKEEVLDSELPVLVDFFAPWCGPCRALAPALEQLAGAYAGRIKVVKVNVDDAQQLAVRYGIRGVPTLMLVRDGETVDTMVGLPSASTLKQKLDAVAAKPVPSGSCCCCS